MEPITFVGKVEKLCLCLWSEIPFSENVGDKKMCQKDYQINILQHITVKLHSLFIKYLIGNTLCSYKTHQNFMFILRKNQISKDRKKHVYTLLSYYRKWLFDKQRTVAVKNARIYSQMQNSLITLYFNWESADSAGAH